jgi:ribose transport system ATP-binding protein
MLNVRNVTKRFPGVSALENVSLDVGRGEVVAVVGENGAGKSTLMKILAGVEQPDGGEIVIDGEPARLESVQDAMRRGIALIHQELNLADNLDVAANIFLGRDRGPLGLLNRRRLARESRQWLNAVGLDTPPDAIVGTLSIGRRQMVEIAKALSTEARIIIMDEPTSSLTLHETRTLLDFIKTLRARGVSIIYISHRLAEVTEVADRAIVLRDGRNAGELAGGAITHDAMVRLMVGRDVSRVFTRQRVEPGEVALSLNGVRTADRPDRAVSFQVRAGEIVGIAGLVGAGRSELLETIFGISPARGGSIDVLGRRRDITSPREAIIAGMGFVPEDRKVAGVILEMSVRENLGLANLFRDQRMGFVSRSKQRGVAERLIDWLRIRTPSTRQLVQFLSGGNQQKVVLGKWLRLEPRVLLLDEPTRGIDVGSKEEIYRLMERLAHRGVAVVFASSEMEEVLAIADRVLVMHDGAIMGELTPPRLTEEDVMRLMTGRAAA